MTRVSNLRDRWTDDDPRVGFESPQEFFEAIAREPREPRGPAQDRRLQFLSTAGSDEHGTHADPHGGFLVPKGFLPRPIARDTFDPIGQRVSKIKMESPKVAIPARTTKDYTADASAGITVSRRAETTEMDASRVEAEQIVLEAKTLFSYAFATETLMRASPEAFSLLLTRAVKDGLTAHLLGERLRGTGAGTMEGVANAACAITVSRELEGAITAGDITDMKLHIWRPSEAVWVCNNDCSERLANTLVEGDAGAASLYHFSEREGEPDTLAGCPIFYSPAAAAMGDRGDLVLANWSEYIEGTYHPLEVAESLHVRFEHDERCFRFTLRGDGAPWWRSPITPTRGAATLSPFVVLGDAE